MTPPSIANFLTKFFQINLYPLRNSPQYKNNITINITKMYWSFIKAPIINLSFTYTQTDTNMHNYTHSVGHISLYNCTKFEPCTSFLSRASPQTSELVKSPSFTPTHPFHSVLGQTQVYKLANVLIKGYLVELNIIV